LSLEKTLLGDALAALILPERRSATCYHLRQGDWIEYRILPQFLKGQRHPAGAVFDLTERKRVENELRDAATHDFLTGLPNRRLLLDRLERALRVSRRQNTYLAVLFLDLDNFKLLNDTHGHDAGDLMLKAVAGRLQSELRDSETVARIGGDEFVVLLEGLGPTRESAVRHSEQIADKLRAANAVEYDLDGIRYHGSISIGIRIYEGNNATPDEIFKDADVAMYQNKRSH
jgi:diguanylate cyclase (GGDEF)-like protein